jgi:acyl-coenzyme A synthetase/AMP-(fatty) acid ligase
MAFVVAPDLSEAQILEVLRCSIDPVFLPRPLVRVAALPRAPSGKLSLDALRELEESAAR